MKQVIIAIILIVVCTTMCNAYSKQMIKANKALLSLERKEKATQKDQQKVVDMLQEVINSAPDMLDKCEASIELAECYSENVPLQIRDYAKAGDLYKKALELVCEHFPSNDTDQPDDVKNLKWKAFYNTGYYCYLKRTPSQDLSKALEYIYEAAYYAPRFHRAVGEFYEFGLGCDIDPEMALMHYTEAMQNHVDCYAKFYSTEYYVNQISADKLDTLAFNDFREGILLQRMAGEQIDYEKVKQHLTAAAKRGYSPAQFELGALYMLGVFSGGKSDENHKLAEEWLKKASDAEYLPALYHLGWLYEHIGFSWDAANKRKKALPFYERAALGGYPPAQSEMDFERRRQEEIAYKNAHALENLANSLKTLGNTVGNAISKRRSMTSAQSARMKQSSYKAKPFGNTSEKSQTPSVDNSKILKRNLELQKRQHLIELSRYDKRTYDSWESKVYDMARDYKKYDDRDRRNYQDHMRCIREKYEAEDLWPWGKSEWETWNGK